MSSRLNFGAKSYNPDVLSCLANLSNDEVFTSPQLANKVLDLLPEEIWTDSSVTFLDPFTKTGVFLREITKRLLIGLEPEFPDLQDRINHILNYQVWGIAITELTALLSRRTLYCSKKANGKYSIDSLFDDPDGHIHYQAIEHLWDGKNCVYCGASKEQYDRDSSLERYTYEFIHTYNPERIFNNMQFDVIVGNPPYQLIDGGAGASAVPIYQKFVEQAKKLNPRFLSMIIPSRWFVGGRGLDLFRHDMLHDDQIRILHDFTDASQCFPGQEIKGGVCYFLWERGTHGDCKIYSHIGDEVIRGTRPLLEKGMETFIRDSRAIAILDKVKTSLNNPMSESLNAGRYFGFHTRVKWDKDGRFGTLQTADGKGEYSISKIKDAGHPIKVYIAHGECWIAEKYVTRNASDIGKYKVLIPRSGNPGSTIIGKPKISEPGSCSSNTYIVFFPTVDSEEAAVNAADYLRTKFVRYLISLRTSTQDMAPRAYEFVPSPDVSHHWSDTELFDKYGLTAEERELIDGTIPPMQMEGDDNA